MKIVEFDDTMAWSELLVDSLYKGPTVTVIHSLYTYQECIADGEYYLGYGASEDDGDGAQDPSGRQ